MHVIRTKGVDGCVSTRDDALSAAIRWLFERSASMDHCERPSVKIGSNDSRIDCESLLFLFYSFIDSIDTAADYSDWCEQILKVLSTILNSIEFVF